MVDSEAVACFKLLNLLKKYVGSYFIDEEDLTHATIGWETLAGDLSFVCWSQDNVDLTLLPLPQLDDLFLQEQILAAIISEDDNQCPRRGDLQSNHQPLGQPLLAVSASVIRFKPERGSCESKLSDVISVNLKYFLSNATNIQICFPPQLSHFC